MFGFVGRNLLNCDININRYGMLSYIQYAGAIGKDVVAHLDKTVTFF